MAAPGEAQVGGRRPAHRRHRTVGYHLYKAYPKLDISSRAQLASLIAEQPPTGPARG